MRFGPKKRPGQDLRVILHHLQSEIFPLAGPSGENFVSTQARSGRPRHLIRDARVAASFNVQASRGKCDTGQAFASTDRGLRQTVKSARENA